MSFKNPALAIVKVGNLSCCWHSISWGVWADLTIYIPGHVDVLWLKRDASVLYQYFYFDDDSLGSEDISGE